MQQDCIGDLYRSLGWSSGAEFSSEDVSLLYRKVFHAPADADETHAAMMKVAGSGNSWSCVGENVLDVLVEMEREREEKEKLRWDLQLLSAGNPNTLYDMDVIDPRVLNGTEANSHNQWDSGSVESGTDGSQRERQVERKERHTSARGVERLKKSARQCWARLASEGLRSLPLHSPWQGQNPGVRTQAWGCVTLSDILLLLGVKYDVVTHLLYKEMLQDHYTLNVWDTMLPWQQHEEEEGLEDLAEEALESGDLLRLAELPGAFRIYSICPAAQFRSSPESREQSWSAVTLLCELHTFRQQEKDNLTVLGERLNRESLTLLSLHIRLATLRAKREKMSYEALLAARQSWDTWPHVRSPCRADQASLWLHVKQEERERDVISMSPQQAVLQLLVLTQEKEREHLVKLVQGVSLEDLQAPVCGEPLKENSHEQAALRNGCIKRLKQLHCGQLAHIDTQNQTNPQLQTQAGTSRKPAAWSPHQLEDCSLVLLTHLMELQEAQASAALPALMKGSAQRVQALRDEYESQLEEQRYTNLLQLLISDAPLHAGSVLASSEHTATPSRCSAPTDEQNRSGGTAWALISDSIREASTDLDGMQVENGAVKQDVCTGCGAAMEDAPYLETLCVSDSTSTALQSLAAEEGAQDREDSVTKSHQNFEKQDSLIALAWSKPPAGQRQDAESGLKLQILPSGTSGEGGYARSDEASGDGGPKPTLFQPGSTGDPDVHTADQQCSTTTEENVLADQTEREAVPEWDLPPRVLEDETLHAEAHSLVDPPEVDCSPAERESTLMESERAGERMSAMERERTMRNLVDVQRKVEQRQQRDRERQRLRVQERLSIIQNRKAEEDLLGLKNTDRLRHLTEDLPQEDKSQQKTVVRERLEQLRRERSYVMQSKRYRNTAGFKELLAPVSLHSRDTEDGAG